MHPPTFQQIAQAPLPPPTHTHTREKSDIDNFFGSKDVEIGVTFFF